MELVSYDKLLRTISYSLISGKVPELYYYDTANLVMHDDSDIFAYSCDTCRVLAIPGSVYYSHLFESGWCTTCDDCLPFSLINMTSEKVKLIANCGITGKDALAIIWSGYDNIPKDFGA